MAPPAVCRRARPAARHSSSRGITPRARGCCTGAGQVGSCALAPLQCPAVQWRGESCDEPLMRTVGDRGAVLLGACCDVADSPAVAFSLNSCPSTPCSCALQGALAPQSTPLHLAAANGDRATVLVLLEEWAEQAERQGAAAAVPDLRTLQDYQGAHLLCEFEQLRG